MRHARGRRSRSAGYLGPYSRSPGRGVLKEARNGDRHSEFRYGSFTRHVALPVTADESDVRASYDKGIMEVSIGLSSVTR